MVQHFRVTVFQVSERVNLQITGTGDLEVDDHHTVEDCALALGQALDRALGDRKGIRRFAHAYAPLDEAVVRTVIDLSGRPYADVNLDFTRREAQNVLDDHDIPNEHGAARGLIHL